MNIPYRQRSEYQPVDVTKLRPGRAYEQLIQKRTSAFGSIPHG